MLYLEDISPGLPELISGDYIEVFKPYSMTPLELVNLVCKKLDAKKGAFSGRLDPMACGATRIFLDQKCGLSKLDLTNGKTYRFQMALGFETTSLDLLGFPKINLSDDQEIIVYRLMERIETFLHDIRDGLYIQELPIYSSYPVSNGNGTKKPLWWWAKEGRIDEIVIPKKQKMLYGFYDMKISYVPMKEIVGKAIERISAMSKNMDFKQSEIICAWGKYLELETSVPLVELVVDVSSGFYIRQLVADIGKFLDMGTTTVEIERLGYINK